MNRYFEKEVGRVEILNRFGNNKVVFNHISEDVFEEIIENKLKMVIENIKKKNKKFRIRDRRYGRNETIFFKKIG